MDKICYKICQYCRIDGEAVYASAMVDELPKDWILNYELNKETFPKIGRIFVFPTLDKARYYNFNWKVNGVIFKGLAKNIGKPKYIVGDYRISRFLERFWEMKKSHKRAYGFSQTDPNSGTLTCSSFIPHVIVN